MYLAKFPRLSLYAILLDLMNDHHSAGCMNCWLRTGQTNDLMIPAYQDYFSLIYSGVYVI